MNSHPRIKVAVEVYLGRLRWMAPFSLEVTADFGHTEAFLAPNGTKMAGHSGAFRAGDEVGLAR